MPVHYVVILLRKGYLVCTAHHALYEYYMVTVLPLDVKTRWEHPRCLHPCASCIVRAVTGSPQCPACVYVYTCYVIGITTFNCIDTGVLKPGLADDR